MEKRVSTKLDKEYKYEPKSSKLSYTVPHVYTPDFVHPTHGWVVLEVKGYFRTSAEASKYVHVKRDNPETEIIFIFSNPFKKAHSSCRPRKDGSVLTLAEWCDKEGFLYYGEADLPEEIVKGNLTKEWISKERKARGLPCLHTTK